MEPSPRTAEDIETAVYPIREVTRLTGVNPVTLRAWERRYGLLRPRRTPKGHRLYSLGDVERVRRILRLVDRGVPVGQVRGVLDGHPGTAPAVTRAFGSEFDSLRRDLLGAAERFAPGQLEQALGRAVSDLPLDVLYRRVLEPAREQLRAESERGGSAAAVRAFLESRVEQRLSSQLGRRDRRQASRQPGVWLQALPGESDNVGVLVYALAFMEAALDPVAVTAPMPAQSLYDVAGTAEVSAIVLIGRATGLDFATEQVLADFARNGGVPCVVGGPASLVGGETVRELGFEVLPPAPSQAAAVVGERIRTCGDDRTMPELRRG